MRVLFVLLAALALSQCATGEDQEFQPGVSPYAVVIIGIAETSENRAPTYSMLWRLLDERGDFTELDDARALELRTSAGDTHRIRGIPGEFAVLRAQPGVYALDGVFGQLREDRLSYIAQGIIQGPERPAFEVRAGEAIYLGIWEMDIEGPIAVTRLWRLDGADLAAVVRAARLPLGDVRMRETHTRSVPCRPHPMSNITLRQVC